MLAEYVFTGACFLAGILAVGCFPEKLKTPCSGNPAHTFTMNSTPQWSAAAARELLELACKALGVDYQRLELIRFGTNAIYRLQPLKLVARVTRPGAPWEWTLREMAITQWLSERGFPTIPPDLSIHPEPFAIYDSTVTFWPWFQQADRPVSQNEFGMLLHDLHQTTNLYPGALPPWEPMLIVDTLLEHIKKSQSVAGADIELLRRWRYWIDNQLHDHPSELGDGVIHGDAHVGNCLNSIDGPILFDFDYVCRGPREWDLIPATLGPRRFGRPREEYDQFAEGYGHDVIYWPGYRISALARELLITCWRLDVESISQVRTEGETRLRYWRRGANPPGWRSF